MIFPTIFVLKNRTGIDALASSVSCHRHDIYLLFIQILIASPLSSPFPPLSTFSLLSPSLLFCPFSHLPLTPAVNAQSQICPAGCQRGPCTFRPSPDALLSISKDLSGGVGRRKDYCCISHSMCDGEETRAWGRPCLS